MTTLLRALLCLLVIALCAPAYAGVTLSPLFSNNAVLQREMPIPIWGWDTPGQEVTVTLDAQSKSVKTDEKGYWIVKLDPMKAGGPHSMTVKGSTTADRNNILIGEVWFCSGQSNMAWTMKSTTHFKEELAAGDQPKIRMISLPGSISLSPTARQWIDPTPAFPEYGSKRLPGAPAPGPMKTPAFSWQVCTPQTLPNFSGVAYHFGKDLSTDLDVPVGLITSAWGGTIIEAWLSKSAIESDPSAARVFKRQQDHETAYPGQVEAYHKQLDRMAQEAKAQAATQPATKPAAGPKKPSNPAGPNAPAVLYNGMVMPVAPYAIRGAIWYQGESNAARSQEYASLLANLIKDWRNTWNQGDFPFLVVQIPNLGGPAWPQMRQAQADAVKSVPNADYAVTIDVGQNFLHPPNKKTVGARLALLALKNTYGKNIIARGPTFSALKIDADKAILTFENTGSGLVTNDTKPPALFEIAGPDNKFVPATASIDGNTITLTSDKVKAPQPVRFAWSDTCPGFNLFNKEGLPAAPFTIDNKPPVNLAPAPQPK